MTASNRQLAEQFAQFSTPLIADAALRSRLPARFAPPGIAAVVPGKVAAARALPARHFHRGRTGLIHAMKTRYDSLALETLK
jgi:hypothetical protein